MEQTKGLVLITDARSKDAAEAAEFLRAQGYDVCLHDPDGPDGIHLWDESALRALSDRLKGRLVGVIHPAPPRILASILEATDEQWVQARNEGVLSAWAVTKVFAERMAQEGGGAMIYLGSIHAEKPVGGGFLYSLGCGATQMLCREASQDYGTRNVRCMYVQAGIREGDQGGVTGATNLYHGVPLRYPQRKYPEEGYLNAMLAFLLTPEAWPLNGADLRADGGMTMFYGHRRPEEGVRYYGRF